MRIFTPYLFFQCVFNYFQCVITLLRALSVALDWDWEEILANVPYSASFNDLSGPF